MAIPLRVLIVEDSSDDAELMVLHLTKEGFQPDWQRVETETDYLATLGTNPDLILADWHLPQFSALRALQLMKKRGLNIPFIIVSGSIGEETAIDALRQGADDYMLKDRPVRLGQAVKHALEDKQLHKERKQVEESLRESEEKYREVVERANDGIAIVQDDVIKYVNPRVAEMWGGNIEETIGTPFTNFIYPEELPKMAARYKRRMAGKDTPPTYETVLMRKDGSKVFAEVNAGIIAYQGKPADLLVVRDITARKRAEEALRESERELKEAQLLGRVGDWEYDLDSQKITWSDQTYKLYERDPVLGPPTAEEEEAFYSPEQVQVLHEYARRAVEEGQDFEYDLEATLPSGKRVSFSAKMRPVKDARGRIVRLFGTVQDITERKKAEEALRLRMEQLVALNQVSQAVATSLDLDQVLTEVMSQAGKVTTSDHASVVLVDKAGLISSDSENQPSSLSIEKRARKRGFTNWIIHSRQPAVVDEIGEDGLIRPRVGGGAPRSANPNLVAKGIKSFIGLPLMVKDHIVGVLYLHSLRPGTFHDQLTLLSTFASQAAIAIEKARLYEEVQKELAERKQAEKIIQQNYDTQSALNVLLQLSLENIPLEDMLKRALDLVLSIPWLALELKGGIFLVGDEPDVLEMKVQNNLGEPIQRICARVPFGKCVCGRAALTQKIQFSNHLDEQHEISYEDIQPHGHYCAPILFAGRTIGVINLYIREGHQQDQKEVEFLAAITNALAGIIERKRAEQEIEALSRFPAENPNPILRVEQDGKIIYANLASEALLHLWNCTVGEYLPSDWRERVVNAARNSARTNVEVEWEERVYSIMVVPIPDSGYVNIYGRDITERVQAEETLRQSEAKYRSIFDNAAEGIFQSTPEGKFLTANSAMARILGFSSPEELIRERTDIARQSYVHPKQREEFKRLMEQQNKVTGFEYEVPRKDGDVAWVSETTQAVRDATGRIVRYEGIFIDITERKQAEAELQASREAERNFAERLTILSETTTELSNAESLDALCRRAVELGRERLDFDRLAIWFVSEDSTAILGTFGVDVKGRITDERGDRFPIRPSDDVWPVLQGQVPLLRIMETPLALKGHDVGQGIHVVASLWDGNTVIGFVSVDNLLRQRPFSDQECEIIRLYASALGHLVSIKRAEEEIHASEERFEKSFQSNPIATIINILPEGRILDVNDTFLRITGYSREEVIGKTGLELGLWENPKDRIRLARALIAQESLRDAEGRLLTKSGESRDMLASVETIQIAGQPHGLIMLNDVTERKRAEEALRAERNLLRTLIDNLPDAIYAKDRRGRKTLVNRADLDNIGRPEAEVLGKTDAELFSSQIAAQFEADDQRVLQSGQPVLDREERLVNDKGTQIWQLTSKLPLIDAAGQVIGLVGIGHDITERKQAEEALAHERNLLRALIDNAPDYIYVKDTESRNLLANMASARQSGSSTPEDMLGKTDFDYYPQELAARYLADDQEVFRSGQPLLHHEETTIDAAGNLQWISTNKVPLRDGQGKIYGLVGMGRDITERKQAEEVVRQSAERFKTLFMSMGDGFYLSEIIYDDSGNPCDYRYLEVNPKFEQIMGLGRDQIVGKRYKELVPVDTTQWLDIYCKVARTGEHLKYEFYSNEYHMYFDTYSYQPTKGQVTVIVSDITERKRAEEKLAQQAEELRRSNEELARLYRASGSLISGISLNFQELAQKIVEVVQQEFGQANCSLLVVQKDSNELVRLVASGPYADRVKYQNMALDGPGLIPLAIRTNKAVNVGDVHSTPDYVQGWEAAQSELAIPLKVGSDVIGVIDVQNSQPNAFSPDDERLMTVFAERAALALGNSRLNTQTEARLQQLIALRTVDMAISGSFDINLTLGILLDQVTGQLGVHAADILAFNATTQTFKFACERGFRTQLLHHTQLKFGAGYAWRAIRERRVIVVPDIQVEPDGLQRSPDLSGEQFVAYLGMPLIAKGQIQGVLEIFHREPLVLEKEWYGFLEMLAGQAAIAIDNAELFDHLQRSNADLTIAYDSTLEGWASALELRDKETEGHTRRVTELTIQLARALGVKEDDMVQMYRGALLHDIGKVGVPDSIVLKPGPLTEDEWVIMRKHPKYAYDMLSPIAYLRLALNIPYCHHEKWDGTGYPRGLKGEQIPLAARLFAVVDVYDALTSDRPYRKAWTREKAISHIREQAGSHFDPEVVKVFLKELKNEKTREFTTHP